MAKVTINESTLTDIGDAIRAKTGGSALIDPADMADEIEAIPSGATLITKNITENGTYNASSDDADGYSSVTVDVPSKFVEVPENDVIFIDDYEQRIVYSYSKSEFLALTEMPSNPQHDGLTSLGWNWSLQDAQDYVAEAGGIVIGQLYTTDDGKVHLEVEFNDDYFTPTLSLKYTQGASVDWGDGHISDLPDGATAYATAPYTHGGKYTIKIAGNFTISGSTSLGETWYGDGNDASGALSWYYRSTVLGVLLPTSFYTYRGGENMNFTCSRFARLQRAVGIIYAGGYSFFNSTSLRVCTIATEIGQNAFGTAGVRYISLPNGVSQIPDGSFQETRLARLLMPKSVSALNSAVFGASNRINYTLSQVYMPEGITRIGGYGSFQYCYALTSIIIPSTVTSIGAQSFQYCRGLSSIIFKPTTPPTVANSNAWTNINANCVVGVPFASLALYLDATNYPNKNTYIYIGYGTYTNGESLPATDTTGAYNVVWYATQDDAINQTNAIVVGNGNEIYCRYTVI